MTRRNKQHKTDEELGLEIGLADAAADGDVEMAGKDSAGDPTFRLTEKGRRSAEALLRRLGVDPHDKAAVERFLFGKAKEPDRG